MRVGPSERDAVQKSDPVPRSVAALPGQSAFLVKVEKVILNLLHRDPLGAAFAVAREPGDGVEMRTHRVLGQAAIGKNLSIM